MNVSGVVILPQEMLDKVDRCRGTLSRSRFIELCITAMADERNSGAGPGKYVTLDELNEFKASIKGLMRNSIDFFLSYSMELSAEGARAGGSGGNHHAQLVGSANGEDA